MQILDRVATILDHLAGASSGLTLSELSTATGLAPGTCHRLLGGLQQARLAERDESSLRWRPGLALVRITSTLEQRSGTNSIDRVLETLRDGWQECFFFSVMTEGSVICIRSVETTDTHRVSVTVPPGRRLPLHAAASGKAIAAQLPKTTVRAMLATDRRRKFTDHTLTRLVDIERDLAATRGRGYAICDQEVEAGVTAFAVPLVGIRDELSSLAVIGPRERMLDGSQRGLLSALMNAVADLGARSMQCRTHELSS
jgi:IclR family transcriptional regulator, acetate operon repressor